MPLPCQPQAAEERPKWWLPRQMAATPHPPDRGEPVRDLAHCSRAMTHASLSRTATGAKPAAPRPHLHPHPLAEALTRFIGAPGFPCVGAKSAVGRGNLKVLVCRSISSSWNDLVISRRLLDFAAAYRRNPVMFQSLAIVFEGPRTLSERQFEASLWERVQSLSDKDRWHGQRYDRSVSPDPTNPHFGLSFGGQAFFIVGLHPHASRKARRFVAPTLIFNLHDQFERLRAENRYEKLRASILDRDKAIEGTINPMLARHGEASEARQYSGRAVDETWQCPFRYGARDAA